MSETLCIIQYFSLELSIHHWNKTVRTGSGRISNFHTIAASIFARATNRVHRSLSLAPAHDDDVHVAYFCMTPRGRDAK